MALKARLLLLLLLLLPSPPRLQLLLAAEVEDVGGALPSVASGAAIANSDFGIGASFKSQPPMHEQLQPQQQSKDTVAVDWVRSAVD